MGYKWLPITQNFDRSLPISKVRWDTSISSTYYSIDDGYFAESPNINTDDVSYSPTGSQKGYADENRFNLGNNVFTNRYYNFADEKWSALTHTTLVAGTSSVYEFVPPITYYWSGLRNSNNYALLNDKIKVYVQMTIFEPSKSTFDFSYTGGTDTFTVTAETGWTSTSAPNWLSLSQTTGVSGTTTITMTCSANTDTTTGRTATITFTNDDADTFTLTINQEKKPLIVPSLTKNKRGSRTIVKEYFQDDKVNKMYRGGTQIYQRMVQPMLFQYKTTDEQVLNPSTVSNLYKLMVSNTYDTSLYGGRLYTEQTNTISEGAYESKTTLSYMTVPSGITSIGYMAFSGCTNLEIVELPDLLTTIGQEAFAFCTSLRSITIPNSVTTIGGAAFNRCYSLSAMTIPSSVTSIGGAVFRNCSGMTTLTVNATTPPTLGTIALSGCSALTAIYVPSASVDAYKAATNWSTYASLIQAMP